jgi:hypothetical protein
MITFGRGRFQTPKHEQSIKVRFEVSTAVTMKNAVLLDVTPYGSCKNQRFGGTSKLTDSCHSDYGGAKLLRNVGSYKSHTA